MTANLQTQGLLYVLVTPSESLSAEDLHAWFKGLTGIDDVLNATTYTAADGQNPKWLSVYELANVDAASAWLSQFQPSSTGAAASFDTLEMRIYELFSAKTSPGYAAALGTERIFRTIGLQPGPELSEKEFNEWYEDEHVPLLSAVPGWLKSTRWILKKKSGWTRQDEEGTVQIRKEEGEEDLARYFSIHEWESVGSFSLPEFKLATNTPWRDRVIPKLDKALEERRNYIPYKQIL